MLKAVRLWKRDNSIYYQELDWAVGTLVSYCTDLKLVKRGEKMIRSHLEAGMKLETPLSFYWAEDVDEKNRVLPMKRSVKV